MRLDENRGASRPRASAAVQGVDCTFAHICFSRRNPSARQDLTAASARSLDLNQMHAEGIIYQFAEVLAVLMKSNHSAYDHLSPVACALVRPKQSSRGHRAGVMMLRRPARSHVRALRFPTHRPVRAGQFNRCQPIVCKMCFRPVPWRWLGPVRAGHRSGAPFSEIFAKRNSRVSLGSSIHAMLRSMAFAASAV